MTKTVTATGSRARFTPAREAVLTTEEVARAMAVSPATVRRMQLPAIEVASGKWRYVWEQVLEALKKRAEAA